MSTSVRFSIYYAIYFIVIAFYLPFFPSWLTSKGLSAEEVALVISAALWGKLLVSPILSWCADYSDRRRMVLIATAAALLGFLSILDHLTGFWGIFIIWAFAGALMTAIIPLIDSLANMAMTIDRMDYGKVRLWGSVSFIVFSFSGGYFLNTMESNFVLTLLMATALCLIAVGFMLPDYRISETKPDQAVEDEPEPEKSQAIWSILTQPGLIAGILTASLLQGSHAALYGLASFHWASIGLDKSQIGQLWATGVLVEVLIFFFGKQLLVHVGVYGLFALAVVAGIIRWIWMGGETEILALSLLQGLHALTFAATHLAAVAYIRERAPAPLISSAQGLYDGLGMGLFIGLAMIGAGWLYENVGTDIAFQSMAGLSLSASFGLWFMWMRKQKREKMQKNLSA